jgi:hypothetical protein
LYQGNIDMTGGTPATSRLNFDLNFYSLARNVSNLGTPNGTPQQINTTGLCMFQFHGTHTLDSKRIITAVESYLTKVGAI